MSTRESATAVGENGEVVLPDWARKEFHIEKGSQVHISTTPAGILVVPEAVKPNISDLERPQMEEQKVAVNPAGQLPEGLDLDHLTPAQAVEIGLGFLKPSDHEKSIIRNWAKLKEEERLLEDRRW